MRNWEVEGRAGGGGVCSLVPLDPALKTLQGRRASKYKSRKDAVNLGSVLNTPYSPKVPPLAHH